MYTYVYVRVLYLGCVGRHGGGVGNESCASVMACPCSVVSMVGGKSLKYLLPAQDGGGRS